MPFVPFPSFDPTAPRSHPAPVLWLRSHAPRWAFPARVSDDEICGYALWLHVHRIGAELGERERDLRPPFSFRIRLCFFRLRIFLGALNGTAPEDMLRHLAEQDADRPEDSNG